MTLRYKAFKFPVLVLGCVMTYLSCGVYGLKGISIPGEVDTFLVETFSLLDPQCEAGMEVLLAEKLRRQIRNETRLSNSEDNPDILFNGQIKNCTTTYVAPAEGTTTSLNRFEISIKVNYENLKDEEDKWTKSYSAFQDYDSNADFQSLQVSLTDIILQDMVERIFNDAFTQW